MTSNVIPMKLTLQQIRDHSPCRDGWIKLLKTLDTDDMTTEVTIGQIARSNGPKDALWCLRCADFDRRDILRAILPSVKRASVRTTDQRVHDCIAAIEQWLNGDDTVDLRAVAIRASDAAIRASDVAAYVADAAAWATCAAGVADVAAHAATCVTYATYVDDTASAASVAEQQKQIEDICEVFA